MSTLQPLAMSRLLLLFGTGVAMALVLSGALGNIDLYIILPFLVLGLFVFWCVQFVDLMRLTDVAFPGRWDKLIWSAFFLLVAPVAPFLFWIWKQAR